MLIELQSSQKQYLFDVGKTRSAQNVRDRILCYVLLFDPKLGGNEDPDIKEWSAYDLFYYLTSLVPAEFQVRTMLADTMAEQYHGVYKSNINPADSVAVQRRRLQEMGESWMIWIGKQRQYTTGILFTACDSLESKIPA